MNYMSPCGYVAPTYYDSHEANWLKGFTAGFVERCYFHSFEKEGVAAIWQPKLSSGLAIRFDPENLDCFTEWKMMGVRDYVLGLEPGNCLPTGRAAMRESGRLKFLDPGESRTYTIRVELFDDAKVLE